MAQETLQEILELEKNGYRATAIRRLENYLRQHPKEAEAWYHLARIHTDPSMQKLAIDFALEFRPDYPEAADFQAVLLAEYPYLANNRQVRRIMLLLILLVIVTSGLALALWLNSQREPEVVVIIPTEEATLEFTETQSPTIAPTQFTLEPTASPVVSATDFPSPTPNIIVIPEETVPNRLKVLIEPLEQSIIEQLTANFPTIQFKILDNPVGVSSNEINLLDDEQAQLIIFSDGVGLTLYGQDHPKIAAQHPRLNEYLRWKSPWRITFEPTDIQLIRGAIAYASYDIPATIDALASTFDNPRPSLTETDTALLFMLAYSYQVNGSAKEALRLYDILTTYTDEPYLPVSINRAYAIAQTGDPESGITLLLSQLNQNPVFVHSTVGDIYWQLGNNMNAAQLAYEDAIRADSTSAFPYIQRGQLWMNRGEYNQAVEDFQLALNADSENALAYYSRAEARLKLTLWGEALTDIDQAIELLPQIGDYYTLRGAILLAQGEWSAAAETLEEALTRGNPSASLYTNLAAAYRELGNLEGAITASSQAINLDPTLPDAWLQRGLATLAQDNPSRALDDLTLGLTYDPRDVDLLVARCTAYARAGDDGAAAHDCDEALSLDGVNGQALEQRGLIRHRADDRAGAASDFQEAILYTPTAYEAHYYLGFYALQERRYSDAITSLTRAIDLQPALGKAYAARGVTYRITEQWQLAIDDLEEAILLLPEDVYSYYELGLAKRFLADQTNDTGNSSQAAQLYQEAADAFLAFLNGSQPTDEFVPQATQALNYVRSALQAVQGQ